VEPFEAQDVVQWNEMVYPPYFGGLEWRVFSDKIGVA
jgi:hypothetical protein